MMKYLALLMKSWSIEQKSWLFLELLIPYLSLSLPLSLSLSL